MLDNDKNPMHSSEAKPPPPPLSSPSAANPRQILKKITLKLTSKFKCKKTAQKVPKVVPNGRPKASKFMKKRQKTEPEIHVRKNFQKSMKINDFTKAKP